jgi:luciferase-like monooxygenase
LPKSGKIAVALRSTTVPPPTIVKLAALLDTAPAVSHVFIPEGSQGGFTSLDISSAALAVSKRVRIGSGVIRILEHDPDVLASRLLTLQEISANRFLLGIGTGRPTSDPKQTIRSMLDRLHSTRKNFEKFAQGSRLKMPETFIATLRRRIAKAVEGHSDGILLNFCPPEHARQLVKSLGTNKRPVVSCYLKIFYSKNEDTAKRMLVEEFVRYDLIPSYHEMFQSAGVAHEIASANSTLASNKDVNPSEKLLRISRANPTKKDLQEYVSEFRDAGVDLPCLYPYFEASEDEAFKVNRVEDIARL